MPSDTITRQTVETPAGSVEVFTEGDGPLVLVLHGWGADPEHLAEVASAIAAQGHRVMVPYLPGRAGSDPTDILQVADVVRGLVSTFGMPAVVVAHSFGAMVARLVFDSEGPRRVVFVAPLVKVSDALDTFGEWLRLAPWARTGIHRRLEAWNPALWPVVNAVRPDQLPGSSLLIVHDPADREASFERAATLAALRPDTEIVPVDGVGHSRIVSDPAVLRTIVGFVSRPADERIAG